MAEKPRQIDEPEQEQESEKAPNVLESAFEDDREAHNAKEIFDLIQKSYLTRLNPEETRRQLLEHGRKEEDIDSALKLMACIGAVNRIAFGEGGVVLNFVPSKHKVRPDIIAMYNPEEKDCEEGYDVRVEGLNEKTLIRVKAKIPLIGKDGETVKNGPLVTLEEAYLGTSIHEARHRFQHQKGSRIFSYKDAHLVGKQLGKIISFVKHYLDIRREDMEKDGAAKETIDSEVNPGEFDAMVVEILAQNKLHEGVILEDFFNLVKIQPPELEK